MFSKKMSKKMIDRFILLFTPKTFKFRLLKKKKNEKSKNS